MDITHGIHFSYTYAITSGWILTHFCWNYVSRFCIWKITEKLCKEKSGVITCDEKYLPWFGVGYEFYSTLWVFSIPSPRLGDRKHTTRRIKIISIPKPWEILYLLTGHILLLLGMVKWLSILNEAYVYFRMFTNIK